MQHHKNIANVSFRDPQAPYCQVRDLLRQHQAVVVSSNYALYGDLSERVMQVLGRFTPALEVYSIDEAWLDLAGLPDRGLDAFARRIVGEVRRWTGIPVSTATAARMSSR